MIIYRNEEEIARVLDNFVVPKLTFIERVNAGPDEELYWYEDQNGAKYGVWSRDYMSELKYETIGLEKEFKIKIKEWIKKKPTPEPPVFVWDDEFLYEYLGDVYGVFKVEA